MIHLSSPATYISWTQIALKLADQVYTKNKMKMKIASWQPKLKQLNY